MPQQRPVFNFGRTISSFVNLSFRATPLHAFDHDQTNCYRSGSGLPGDGCFFSAGRFSPFFQPDTTNEKLFIPRDYKDVQADSSFVGGRQNV